MILLELLQEPLPDRWLVRGTHCPLAFAAPIAALDVEEVAVAADQDGS